MLQCLERIARLQTTTHGSSAALPPPPLQPKCLEAVNAQQQQMIDSVHLNYPLVSACQAEIAKVCSSASSPQVDLLGCLQSKAVLKVTEFSQGCIAAVSWVTQTQLSDIRFNPKLTTACALEISSLCPETRVELDGTHHVKVNGTHTAERTGGVILECLARNAEVIKSPECRREVRGIGTVLTNFPTANLPLMKSCEAEFAACIGPHSGGATLLDADVRACLLTHRANFSERCREKTDALEKLAHRELAFNANIRVSCGRELEGSLARCKGVDSHLQLQCLWRARGQADSAEAMSDECSRTLRAFQLRAHESLELLEPVRKPCADDFKELCFSSSAISLPGFGLQCLKDNMDSLRGAECKRAVFELIVSTSADAQLDPVLSRVCIKAVKECMVAGVAPGEGRIHACLRARAFGRWGSTSTTDKKFDDKMLSLMDALGTLEANESQRLTLLKMSARPLTRGCAQQVTKLAQAEHDDVRMSYPLRRSCKTDLQNFCADVPPTQGQGLACLESHARQRDFSQACGKTVKRTLQVALEDYRLMPQVRTQCSDFIKAQCAWNSATQHGGMASNVELDEGLGTTQDRIFECLIRAEEQNNVTQACGAAVRSAARSAFANFEWARGITMQCDADIFDKCASTEGRRGAADVNGDGRFSGEETWTCINQAAHDDGWVPHDSHIRATYNVFYCVATQNPAAFQTKDGCIPLGAALLSTPTAA